MEKNERQERVDALELAFDLACLSCPALSMHALFTSARLLLLFRFVFSLSRKSE
jgi:hypothetical protein